MLFHPVLWEVASALRDFLRELMEEKGITVQVPFQVKRKAAAELCLQDQGDSRKEHCTAPTCTAPLAALQDSKEDHWVG